MQSLHVELTEENYNLWLNSGNIQYFGTAKERAENPFCTPLIEDSFAKAQSNA